MGLRDMYAYAIQTAKGKFHGGAEERPNQVPKRRPHNGCARRQDFGRNDGCDGVRRVVKAVDVLERERGQQDEQEEGHEGGMAAHSALRSRGPMNSTFVMARAGRMPSHSGADADEPSSSGSLRGRLADVAIHPEAWIAAVAWAPSH